MFPSSNSPHSPQSKTKPASVYFPQKSRPSSTQTNVVDPKQTKKNTQSKPTNRKNKNKKGFSALLVANPHLPKWTPINSDDKFQLIKLLVPLVKPSNSRKRPREEINPFVFGIENVSKSLRDNTLSHVIAIHSASKSIKPFLTNHLPFLCSLHSIPLVGIIVDTPQDFKLVSQLLDTPHFVALGIHREFEDVSIHPLIQFIHSIQKVIPLSTEYVPLNVISETSHSKPRDWKKR